MLLIDISPMSNQSMNIFSPQTGRIFGFHRLFIGVPGLSSSQFDACLTDPARLEMTESASYEDSITKEVNLGRVEKNRNAQDSCNRLPSLRSVLEMIYSRVYFSACWL